ncbi:MAG: hypothetical protein ABI333_28440 [bacterium]
MSDPAQDNGSPLVSAPSSAPTTGEQLTALLERISGEYVEGDAARHAAGAREDFLAATGRVHEGDRAFDERMAQFMEWFLLDRPLVHGGGTPCERFVERGSLSADDRRLLRGLCASHRSLFSFVARDRLGRMVVDDLLYGMRWTVTAPEGLPGTEPGDVFEGRVVGIGGEVHFTTAFCYHPREAAPRIARYAARRQERGPLDSALLDELMAMRLAYDRAEGAPVDSVYRFGA